MKKKVVIPVSIAAVAAVAIGIAALTGSSSNIAATDSMLLAKSELQSTISITGNVESNSVRKVYSNLNYTVEKINVEVGDEVKKGDVLCQLDTDQIEKDILQQKASLNTSNITSDYQLTDAEKKYDEALEKYNSDNYPTVVAAKTALDKAETNLDLAKKSYDRVLELTNTDKDTQLIKAQNSIKAAEIQLEAAKTAYKYAEDNYNNKDTANLTKLKKNYDDAKEFYEKVAKNIDTEEFTTANSSYENALQSYEAACATGDINTINSAKTALDLASANLDKISSKYNYKTAKEDYEDASKKYFEAKNSTESLITSSYDQARLALLNAEKNLEMCKKELEVIQSGNTLNLYTEQTKYNDAQKTAEDARKAYETALDDSESQLADLKAAAEKSRLLSENDPQLIALEKFKSTLEDCTITSPIDGTVTAVYAVEGGSGMGLLFVVEDTDNLKITSKVKEYDISYIDDGQQVIIKSDSIGSDDEYNGIISKVSPTTNKDATGNDAGSGEFDVDISVSDKDTALMVGMTTKLTVITEQKENIYAVKYEAVNEDEDGNSFIYTAEKSGANYIAKKIMVQTGIESDFDIEIISDELNDGMIVLTDTDLLYDGAPVKINSEQVAE